MFINLLKKLVLLSISMVLVSLLGGCKNKPDEILQQEKFIAAKKIWHTEGLPSEKYFDATFTILEYMETDNQTWLTLGDIIKELGSDFSFATDIEYVFDKDGNIDGVWYKYM